MSYVYLEWIISVFVCCYTFYFSLPNLRDGSLVCMKSVKVLWVSLSAPVILFICVYLLVWPFTFTEKSACDILVTPRINLVLPVIIAITVLLQTMHYEIMLLVLCGQFHCLSVCIFQKVCVSHQWCYFTSAYFFCNSHFCHTFGNKTRNFKSSWIIYIKYLVEPEALVASGS